MRKLPSGRYQASYVGPDLKRHAAPYTFEAAIDAEGWLAQERRLVASDEPWTPPRARFEALRAAVEGGMTLRHFAPEALARRRTRGKPLRPKTMSLYEGLLRRVIYPRFGDVPMRLVTDDDVSGWFDGLDPDTPTQNAHAYALLHGLFVDAVHPKQRAWTGVTANPCTVKGAGTVQRRHEIRTAALVELDALLEHTAPRFRALVVVAFAWCGLRFGEAAELQQARHPVNSRSPHRRAAGTHRPPSHRRPYNLARPNWSDGSVNQSVRCGSGSWTATVSHRGPVRPSTPSQESGGTALALALAPRMAIPSPGPKSTSAAKESARRIPLR